MLWSSIPKKQGHTKIDDRIKNYCYNWILQHTQVVKSPITNDPEGTTDNIPMSPVISLSRKIQVQ